MTLPVPNLDDRTFVDLVREARERIAQAAPEWSDLSVHDPGMVLVETFAHLTEVMLYRLNRLPAKAYVTFLNLLGVSPHPPSAAWVDLTFTRTAEHLERISIPAGTRIAAARGGDPQPVVFVVTEAAEIPAGATAATVRAHHCEPVEGELLGTGTGMPGQVLRARRTPIVTTVEPADVVLGVETPAGALPEGASARDHDGRTYEVWRLVRSFAGFGPTDKVFLLDRGSGTVTFAPALDLRDRSDGAPVTVAAVPPAGRQIRLWYRTGGGPTGNVAAGTLTALRDPIEGVQVSNDQPARGGRAAESLEAAMVRGPYEFFSAHRAITARDFELLATAGAAGVARAKAFTRTQMWSFARPGEVEVVLVPDVPSAARQQWRLPAEALLEQQSDEARRVTEQDLDRRRALGTSVVVNWARYKAVSVRATVVVAPHENPDEIRRRIHDRLYQTISPLPTPLNPTGAAFGAALHGSNVSRLLEQASPGVRYVQDVRFVLDQTPDQRIRSIAADRFQPKTWYGSCENTLFRSTNDGRDWEPVGSFAGEEVRRIVPAPAAVRPGMSARPGWLAVLTRTSGGSAVYVSEDLGNRWEKVAELDQAISDLTWIDRDENTASLLLAADRGLYELALLPGAVPLQTIVDHAPRQSFYAVESFVSERGVVGVAVAAQARGGIYVSTAGGRTGTFTRIGFGRDTGVPDLDTRTLAVQYDGPATLLWVGAGEADASRPGPGCVRARMFEARVKWEAVNAGWTGGTCWDLAFSGTTVVAATQSGGVLKAALSADRPRWESVGVNSGLPLRDRTRFEPVEAVAAAGGQVLAGTARGVHRATGPESWAPTAVRERREMVSIPETWLFCSGDHDVQVVRDRA